jgi:hypothetical protein
MTITRAMAPKTRNFWARLMRWRMDMKYSYSQ